MRWEGSDRGRYTRSRQRLPQLPVPGRVILGSLAIAAIILAFLSNPVPQAISLPKAPVDAKPTTVAAAIIPVPTIAPASPTPAPTSSVQATPSPSGMRTHEVAQGDTLSSIAKKYYGDSTKWNKIMDANKDILKSPESLQLGQKLKIPE